MRLNESKKRQTYIVSEIKSDSEEQRNLFYKMGLYPGEKVEVKTWAPISRDPMLLQLDSGLLALTKSEANCLEVSEAN